MRDDIDTVIEALEYAEMWVKQMREGVDKWSNGSCGLDARCQNMEVWIRTDVAKALAAAQCIKDRFNSEPILNSIEPIKVMTADELVEALLSTGIDGITGLQLKRVAQAFTTAQRLKVANRGNERLAMIIQFVHDRMINVHGENENVDYLHGLRDAINVLRSSAFTS